MVTRSITYLVLNLLTSFFFLQYQGIWYNIESYPAPFQGGTCGTAEYTLDGGVVIVRNTQVLNQVLDVQTGIAEVVGNAKLAVTFQVNNVSGKIILIQHIAQSYSC